MHRRLPRRDATKTLDTYRNWPTAGQCGSGAQGRRARDQTVWFLSAHTTNWWKNFRQGDVPVTIEIAKETLSGTAQLWDGDTDELREHVRSYLCALPRDAKVYGIKLDQNRAPIEASLARAAPTLVMDQVELDRIRTSGRMNPVV